MSPHYLDLSIALQMVLALVETKCPTEDEVAVRRCPGEQCVEYTCSDAFDEYGYDIIEDANFECEAMSGIGKQCQEEEKSDHCFCKPDLIRKEADGLCVPKNECSPSSDDSTPNAEQPVSSEDESKEGPKDCVYGEWTDWSRCNSQKNCSTGRKIRSRTVLSKRGSKVECTNTRENCSCTPEYCPKINGNSEQTTKVNKNAGTKDHSLLSLHIRHLSDPNQGRKYEMEACFPVIKQKPVCHNVTDHFHTYIDANDRFIVRISPTEEKNGRELCTFYQILSTMFLYREFVFDERYPEQGIFSINLGDLIRRNTSCKEWMQ